MGTISAPKIAIARVAGALSRGSGRGGGTSLPGKVLLKLQDDAIVVITANDASGSPIDFPAALRLRGKNGDILEPHTPSMSDKG